MDNLQIRRTSNPNLWWVSLHGDDVAYTTRPGNAYLAWPPTSGNQAMPTSVGKRFDTVDEALEAVARSQSRMAGQRQDGNARAADFGHR